MTNVKIATFNCENLFARFQFRKNIDPQEALIDGWTVNQTKFDIYDETAKNLTGRAILETDADILGLQEVENLDTLRKFRTDFLKGRKNYPHPLVIDGNDPRRIDVGVLSKHPITEIRTHVNEYDAGKRNYTFSRDCLECTVDVGASKNVLVFVNHFKSMLDRNDPCNGRKNTHDRRKQQADKVKEIVTASVENLDEDYFVIMGDFNDYLDDDSQGPSSIKDLVTWNKVKNIVDVLPQNERWTHFYKGSSSCGQDEQYRQLDYLLISKKLAELNPNPKVKIVREGIPFRADRYAGERFAGVGINKPKASDHCPLVVELEIP